MIPLFSDEDGQVRINHTYNGLTINNPSDGNDLDVILVRQAISQTPLDTIFEKPGLRDGAEVYAAFKRLRSFRLDLEINASSLGLLYDLLDDFSSAFDPALASQNDPDNFGFLPYDFNVPTADTVNYPSGLIACRYYLRAAAPIEPNIDDFNGRSLPYRLVMQARDPRRYLQTQSTLSVVAGVQSANDTLASYPSWATLTITMAGAGSSSFGVNNGTLGKSLVLDLSGRANGDVVVVDMERRKITVNGVETPSLYVSGDYWWIKEATSNTITAVNTTNATISLAWRKAFAD